jgi:hypothetical protein
METTTNENFLHQVKDTTGLMKSICQLEEENRKLAEEVFELRVLARLATVISIIEGSNARQHKELLEADRKYEELMQRHTELLERSAEFIARKEQANEDHTKDP